MWLNKTTIQMKVSSIVVYATKCDYFHMCLLTEKCNDHEFSLLLPLGCEYHWLYAGSVR